MPVKYVDYQWTMDREKLHRDIAAWCKKNDMSVTEGLMLCDLSASWSNPRDATYPTVRNLMTVCSLMDLDPRDYFVLDLP